jgi:hypothetical protein
MGVGCGTKEGGWGLGVESWDGLAVPLDMGAGLGIGRARQTYFHVWEGGVLCMALCCKAWKKVTNLAFSVSHTQQAHPIIENTPPPPPPLTPPPILTV